MSVVLATTFTVTQADVLYVSQQIKRDLMALRGCYPSVISDSRILKLDIGIGTLLINDAVSAVGFSIEDPTNSHLVYHELRYSIHYSGIGQRTGVGGRSLTAMRVPRAARLTSWVTWSKAMKGLPVEKQRQIVQGTGWGIPGSNYFNGRYAGSSFKYHSTYGSGPLVAEAEEYRHS